MSDEPQAVTERQARHQRWVDSRRQHLQRAWSVALAPAVPSARERRLIEQRARIIVPAPAPVIAQDKRPPRDGILKPVHPSAGIEDMYRRRLEALIEDMHRSLIYWIGAAYRQNEPELAKLIAEDASPAQTLRTVVRQLARRWQRRFNEAAPQLADYFATEASERSDLALKRILSQAGISVEFKATRAKNDVMQAQIAENVSLIRSIPAQNFTTIEGMVMRSVAGGRDLQSLTQELRENFDVIRRRAELIARDQNNKATAAMQRLRQIELDIEEAVWLHSGGGKHPRPSHVKAGRDKVRYKVAEGWFDPAIKRWIWPGTEISCRCVCRPVVPGF